MPECLALNSLWKRSEHNTLLKSKLKLLLCLLRPCDDGKRLQSFRWRVRRDPWGKHLSQPRLPVAWRASCFLGFTEPPEIWSGPGWLTVRELCPSAHIPAPTVSSGIHTGHHFQSLPSPSLPLPQSSHPPPFLCLLSLDLSKVFCSSSFCSASFSARLETPAFCLLQILGFCRMIQKNKIKAHGHKINSSHISFNLAH